MAEETSKGAREREYMVLKLAEDVPGRQLWEPLRVERAASKEAAAKLGSANTEGDAEFTEGTFKAVTLVAWRGATTVDNEIKTVARFREAAGLDGEAEGEPAEPAEEESEEGEPET